MALTPAPQMIQALPVTSIVRIPPKNATSPATPASTRLSRPTVPAAAP